MKVILLRDVAKLGRKSEIKEVPAGHANNFLIPRKLVMVASKENIERIANEAGKHASKEQSTAQAFRDALEKTVAKPIEYKVEANEQGHLFKGIHAEDIAILLNTHGFSLTKQHVSLKTPIKSLGIHTIELKQAGVVGSVQLHIVKK